MAATLARAVPAWAWLGTLVVISAAIRFRLARGVVAPWIVVDELIHSGLARSFAATGHFQLRGHPIGAGYGVVYQALISAAYKLFGPVPEVYTAAKAINAVLMSLAAVPAYFLARRVLSPWLSLLAAVLTVAVPSMVYTGELMTENAFYPLFLCAALALVLYLERPGLGRAIALVAVSWLAFETRAEGIALLPAVLTAPLLLVWFDRRGWQGLRAYRSLYSIMGGGLALLLVVQLGRGRSPLDVGAYEHVRQSHYAVRPLARWLLYHVAELDLYVAVIPFAAFLMLVVLARRLSGPARVFLAAALPLASFVLLEAAAAATSSGGLNRIADRHTFYVAPLLLTALLVWIHEGAPRPGLAGGIAAGWAAALPALIPYSKFVNGPVISDTLAFVPLWTLHDSLSIGFGQVRILMLLAAVVAAAVFALIPRRFELALVALVAVCFSVEQWPIETGPHSVRETSMRALRNGITNENRDWIDLAVGRGARVAVVWASTNSLYPVWENEFFNRSIHAVYQLQSQSSAGLPTSDAFLDEHDHLVRDEQGFPVRARYVLTDRSLRLDAQTVAGDSGTGMTLYRVGGAVRFVSGP